MIVPCSGGADITAQGSETPPGSEPRDAWPPNLLSARNPGLWQNGLGGAWGAVWGPRAAVAQLASVLEQELGPGEPGRGMWGAGSWWESGWGWNPDLRAGLWAPQVRPTAAEARFHGRGHPLWSGRVGLGAATGVGRPRSPKLGAVKKLKEREGR